MSHPVMVSLDGSAKDARALTVGAALAGLAGTELALVHVLDTPAGDRRDGMRRALAEAADALARETGRQATSEVLEGADVPGMLTRHAAERRARALVMGTRAAGRAGRALRGSVADRVMRESTRPVVLVPPAADRLRDKTIEIARVLVPLDGSALASRSIDYLLDLPQAERLEYVLLEVIPASSDEATGARAEQRLAAAAGRVRARGAAAVEVAVIAADDAAAAIVRSVRERVVDLIAMSTRGAGGLRRMVLGSVAEGVVRASEVPVLLLTPADLDPAGER